MFWHADALASGQVTHARDGNAFVNGINTHYYNRGEKGELPDMFEFASRLLTKPTLAPQFMLEERSVIAREYDFRVRQDPLWPALSDSRKTLYGDHPIARSVIGTPESISSMSLDEVNEYHDSYYHPQNAILVVSGDVSRAQVKQLTNQYFKPMTSERSGAVKNTQAWRDRRVEASLNSTKAYSNDYIQGDTLVRVSLGNWAGTGDAIDDVYAQLFLKAILDSNLPGSIAKPLRLNDFVVAYYEVTLFPLLDRQIEFIVIAGADDGISLDTVRERFTEFLNEQAEAGIPLETVERVRKRLLQTAKRLSNDSTETLWRLLKNLTFGIPGVSGEEHIKRLASVKKESLDSLLRALADSHRVVTGYVTREMSD